jgi:hypothetical protein
MAGRIAYYGGIVKEGLVLNLDAAKKDSYPGSGLAWNDISGTTITGSLINGPTFSTSGSGAIVFDGTNDYVKINPSNFSYPNGITVEWWVKVPVDVTNYGGIGQSTITSDSMTTNMWMMSGYPGPYYTWQVNNSGSWVSLGTSTLSLNTWYCITGTASSTQTNLYLNGALSNGPGAGVIIPTNSNSSIVLGGDSRYVPNSRFLNGNISNVKVYNRALSATEILQNYNATKTRFGL